MTPEIYTHNGFITFFKSLVTANANLDSFFRFDLAELLKAQSQFISPAQKTVFILERNEKQTIGENNSQVHEERTIAFMILRASSPGSYSDHDTIYDNTETIAMQFLDQIEAYMDADEDSASPSGDLIHLFRNSVSINQVGPLVGGRYGVRVVFQMISKGRPPVD